MNSDDTEDDYVEFLDTEEDDEAFNLNGGGDPVRWKWIKSTRSPRINNHNTNPIKLERIIDSTFTRPSTYLVRNNNSNNERDEEDPRDTGVPTKFFDLELDLLQNLNEEQQPRNKS